jgi:protein-L-isoaspartate(D-aspartate) O-methyltransferase
MFEQKRKRLVENLKLEGRIKSKSVEEAFLKIPRENFVTESVKNFAYADTPLEIGSGQTISAPHMVAIMCEALDVNKGHKILEIGAGSGYHSAIVSELVGKNGRIYTVERHGNLAEFAENNLKKTKIKNVIVKIGDGSLGLEEYSPYDRIYVTCSAPNIPQPLIDQLKDGGKMLIPVGRMFSKLVLIEKEKGKIKEKDLGGCSFVPLVGKFGF